MIDGKILDFKQFKIVQLMVCNKLLILENFKLIFLWNYLFIGDARDKIFNFGGLPHLLAVLTQTPVLKESLLILAVNCILNCIANGL